MLIFSHLHCAQTSFEVFEEISAMDKFLNKGPIHSTKSIQGSNRMAKEVEEKVDLLHQLRSASAKNQNNDQNQQDKLIRSSSEQLWDPYFSRNSTYSISDISMSSRISNSGKTLQGWKIVDKKRVYTTFRNGKMVQGEGAEGFKLSIGDAPKCKGKKRGPHEISKQTQLSDVNRVGCNNDDKYGDSNSVTNSRTNSCLVVESSKKIRDCEKGKKGVFDFSFS